MARSDQPHEKPARNAAIVEFRKDGNSFQQIGDALGISRQRAHQIFKREAARRAVQFPELFEEQPQ